MYYPIIDRLKEVMADITSIKDKQPLIIEGTITSTTGGTWTGNGTEIQDAFYGNIKPVFFKLFLPNGTQYIVPVISCSHNYATSCLFVFNDASAYGSIAFNANKTFSLNVVR